jgi:hypothetical protein
MESGHCIARYSIFTPTYLEGTKDMLDEFTCISNLEFKFVDEGWGGRERV